MILRYGFASRRFSSQRLFGVFGNTFMVKNNMPRATHVPLNFRINSCLYEARSKHLPQDEYDSSYRLFCHNTFEK